MSYLTLYKYQVLIVYLETFLSYNVLSKWKIKTQTDFSILLFHVFYNLPNSKTKQLIVNHIRHKLSDDPKKLGNVMFYVWIQKHVNSWLEI